MINQSDEFRQEVLQKLSAYLKDRISPAQVTLIKDFAQYYYGSVSIEDLRAHATKDLLGALLSHWAFIYQREPGTAKVRVFNPSLEKEGWQSKHTILEISHDDIPFLVDSIRMEITRSGLQIHFAIHLGGLRIVRDAKHRITEIVPLGTQRAHSSTEAPIYMEIDRQNDPAMMEELQNNIARVLTDVRMAVQDWRPMVKKVEDSLQELERNPPPLDKAELAESKDFLRWLINNNFTFLGSRDYKLIGNETNRALQVIPKTGLGVLRDGNNTGSTASRSYADLPPQARKLALSKNVLIIAKTSTKASVHRSVYTDYIGVKRFNDQGELIGERRFVGLYTSAAYHSSPQQIPFLHRKVAKIIEELHFPANSHNGKEVIHILETLPRDDLLQATHEELTELTLGILHLQERSCIRLFVRKDAYNRYYSCLVYVPREIFNTELSLQMEEVLKNTFRGIESNFTTYFSDSVLARIHFLIRVDPKLNVDYDVAKIEQKLIAVARSWSDELKTHLLEEYGEADGLRYYNKYRKAFPSSYTEFYLPTTAINDIKKIENLSQEKPLGMVLYQSGKTSLRLKLFHIDHTIALSDVLPTLENLGLRIIGERPHEVIFRDGSIVWVSDFDMLHAKNKEINIAEIKDIFQEAFAHIWFGDAEDDGFNQLVLEAQLTWRETAILRAYTKYLRQTGFTFSQAYVEQALVNNPTIAKALIELFILRFSPTYLTNQRPDTAVLAANIEQLLDAVASLDEDRILRRLLEVILATLRTNYFQTNGSQSKSWISFKLDPTAISDLPLPRPRFEIFVYSPRVEGVHLRGGKVARGGIRWSDRREDFRTEILGLMKAQQVKNSVIVPVGAKGGFFPKLLPVNGDRDTVMKEVVTAYSTFIRGLLDITDNIVDNKIAPPRDVVRYDEDDPYLVVAADKGTATFSDIANAISAEYRFWLGDAFASGGSAGYDHKKMAITARGAWESVKRHFRESNGLNPEKEDFTVIGIGDMSGDVFGNGMLMSKHIKLIAGFDHRHIFIDPNPNPKISYQERARLFKLPRSSWQDYNPELISSGGGVYSRSAKSIKLSPEVKALLDIKKELLAPNDLIRVLLKAPVDLIWNGGIGTFAKASYESHTDVGDRTNDAIRVDANEIQARQVGEGGNLGFTQSARVEYSLNGGIIYTDFIDNSGGVDCSDHEVNIKILLNKLVANGTLTLTQRNKLLEKMTDEVAELVLRDNYEQTQMLSLEASVSLQTVDLFRRYMRELEKQGRLNRHLESLPDDKILVERKKSGQGLTRPELAILLACSKMFLKQDLLLTSLPEDPYFTRHLMTAFPKTLCKKYLPQLRDHSLRREIIATQVSKHITDHMGINFVDRLQRETGASIEFIVRAFIAAERIYDIAGLFKKIEALDYQVTLDVQQKMMLQAYYLARRATRWFLRNRKPTMKIETTVDTFAGPVEELAKKLPELLTKDGRLQREQDIQEMVKQNVPIDLATRIANCNTLFTSLDIIEIAGRDHARITEVAKTYYNLGASLELNWLREQINTYPIENQWDELSRSGCRDDLDRLQRKLSISVLKLKSKKPNGKSVEDRIDVWLNQHEPLIQRWQNLLTDIKSSTNTVNFVTYSVVLHELHEWMV